MAGNRGISEHYSDGGLLARLNAALAGDGADPEHPSLDALAPYDQFHGRGLVATREIADRLEVSADDRLLDVGSGIGGPARTFAARFGCRISGIDLTEEFCAVGRHLNRLTGLDDKISLQQGDALAMPFADAGFDGAYSINVSMNIADKAALYREIHRVLKPGGGLLLSELALGPAGHPDYPTPWAASAETSFLATPADTEQGLAAAGFDVLSSCDRVRESLAASAAAKALVERGEKPPLRSLELIHGTLALTAARNTTRGVARRNLIPIEIHCRKRM